MLCDYSMGGFVPPEMVKRRPAIVLAGALPRRGKLLSVVPLSGTEADPRNLYQCRLELDKPLPEPFAAMVWWVKADMIATVGFDRLDLFRTARDQYGKRKYLSDLRVSAAQLDAIKQAVRHALNL